MDFCVISGDAKSRKPDEAFYKYAILKCKIDPHESVFVGDRHKNLMSAEKLGFKTVFCSTEITVMKKIFPAKKSMVAKNCLKLSKVSSKRKKSALQLNRKRR